MLNIWHFVQYISWLKFQKRAIKFGEHGDDECLKIKWDLSVRIDTHIETDTLVIMCIQFGGNERYLHFKSNVNKLT